MKRKNQRRRVGDIVEVPLEDGQFGYGQVLEAPLIAFFDVRTKERLPVEAILARPVIFSIWVMYHAITKGEWTVIGHAKVPDSINQNPPFFKKDNINGRLSITYDGGQETPATLEEVKGLECAAVWEPEHVVGRLNDHFAGRPNIWAEKLRPT